MAVIKHSEIKPGKLETDGLVDVFKASVIGPDEGWKENTLRVFIVKPGGFTPRHQHDWEHVIYIMRGKGVVMMGDNSIDIAEKDFAFIPPGAVHQLRNPSEEDLEFICIVPNRGA